MKCGEERRVFRTKCNGIRWWLLALCTVLASAEAGGGQWCFGVTSPGVTIPRGDVVLLFGQPLELLCLLNPEKAGQYNSSHLSFRRNNETVEPELLSVVNETALRLFDPNPAMSESVYTCEVANKERTAVCLNKVIVATEPQPVKHFNCLSLNWDNLTCTWSTEPNYLPPNYALTFRFPYRAGRGSTYSCPNVTMDSETNVYSCYWDLTTSPLYRQSHPQYLFRLHGKNKLGEMMDEFTFNHYAHVKPSPPMDLRVGEKTPHSALLTWKMPGTLNNFPKGLVHRVRWLKELDKDWETVDVNLKRSTVNHYQYNLTNLPYAFWPYAVHISIHSEEASNEQFWSEPAWINFRSLGELPARPPDTDMGNFEVTANLDHRNVTIYWRQLRNYEENGENFHYSVEVRSEGIKIRDISSSNKAYVKYQQLPFKPLEFFVTSVNKLGQSANSSRVVVPAQTRVMAEPMYFTKAALGNGVYELNWKPPHMNLSLLESYTVYWCDHLRDRPYQCEGRLDWERVPANVTARNYTVTEDKIHQFAISANGFGTSSGMVWASCTIIPNKPIGKIKEVWTDPVGSTSLKVGWKLECFDNMGAVRGYQIFYCPSYGLQNNNCREPIRNITVNQTFQDDTRVMLQGLRPYTTYAIQVSIIAQHAVGPQSDPVLGTTNEGAPEPPRAIRISNLSATSMNLSWEAPVRMNGILKYYEVGYKIEDGNWETHKVNPDANLLRSQMELHNLSSYSIYTVHVRACTVACSNSSEQLVVRTAIGRPGPVPRPSLESPSSPTGKLPMLEWTKPYRAGGALDLYKVRLIKVRDSINVTEFYNTTELQLEVPERLCQEEGVHYYLFEVFAINFDTAEDHGAMVINSTEADAVSIEMRRPDEQERLQYEGPWSEPAQSSCIPASSRGLYWLYVVLILVVLAILGWLLNRFVRIVQRMSSIKPVMPDGLFPEPEKESKHPLDWKPPSKHSKERTEPRPTAPADEVSLLSAPPAPASPREPNTTSTSLSGGSSRRAPSPAWPAFPAESNGWAADEDASDADVTPTNMDNPYVSFATEKPTIGDGYVQASIMDSIPKSSLPLQLETVATLPPSYVKTAPNSAASSPFRTLPPLVNAYVTVDDPRISGSAAVPAPTPLPPPGSTPLPELKKNKSGYVKHEDITFAPAPSNGYVQAPPPPLVPPEHPILPKRISAPPLLNTKIANDDKRISLNYTTLGLENPSSDPACSPEYCRFGWNSPEVGEQAGVGPGLVLPYEEENPAPLSLAALAKEEYQLPLEELLSEEPELPPGTTTTQWHYVPLNLHSLKS